MSLQSPEGPKGVGEILDDTVQTARGYLGLAALGLEITWEVLWTKDHPMPRRDGSPVSTPFVKPPVEKGF